MTVERWRSYLLHSEFTIRTDHWSLVCLDEQRHSTSWEHKALTKLLGLQYKIEYRKGASNLATDALSRQPTATPCVVSVCVPKWLHEVKAGYKADPQCTKILASTTVGAPLDSLFQVTNGFIRYKGRVWLGTNTEAQ